MAIYLLDFENVHDSGIVGVTSLTEKDELYIFYSVKSEHMSFESHVNIMKTAATVKYIKLRRAAKNYLDFQLCTHLGYIIGAGFEGPYYIISKDTGYDSAVDYWKDHGVTIIRQPSIGFNRSLGKSTGQNPAHNTPPALVTFKQGNQVTTPDVALLYHLDTGRISEEEAAAFANTETAGEDILSIELSAETIEEPAVSEQVPVAEEAQEQTSSGSRKSRSRRSSSKKVTAHPQETETDTKEEALEPESKEPAVSEDSTTKKSASKSKKKTTGKETAVKEETAKEEVKEVVKESVPQMESAAPALPEENAEPVPIKPDTLPESYRKRVRTALKGKNIPSAYYTSIYKAILNSYDKLALNNLLVKTFGSSKGGEVYKLLKDIFTDFQS